MLVSDANVAEVLGSCVTSTFINCLSSPSQSVLADLSRRKMRQSSTACGLLLVVLLAGST